MFRDVLLAVDFDRTFTGPDSKIPARNLEATQYFMENGGAFTINTGRTPATFWRHLDEVKCNAPMLMYNGSAAYWQGKLQDMTRIDLPVWELMGEIRQLFPDMLAEIQATDVNYLIDPSEEFVKLCENMHWKHTRAVWGQAVGPFLKFALWGKVGYPAISDMYHGTEEELRRFDEAEEIIAQKWGDKLVTFRPAPRIIDVHAKGVSKANAARRLQEKLGKKLLVCVGDGENDVSMLCAADFAYCPADAVVADRFENVCPCGQGAVADVIYNKLPKILK